MTFNGSIATATAVATLAGLAVALVLTRNQQDH